MILLEAGLSFLGLGVQPPTPSWGNIMQDGADRLAALVLGSGAELFHAPDQTGFAAILHDGHRETWPLKSPADF